MLNTIFLPADSQLTDLSYQSNKNIASGTTGFSKKVNKSKANSLATFVKRHFFQAFSTASGSSSAEEGYSDTNAFMSTIETLCS